MKLSKLLITMLLVFITASTGCRSNNDTPNTADATDTTNAESSSGADAPTSVDAADSNSNPISAAEIRSGIELVQRGVSSHPWGSGEYKKWEQPITITVGKPMDLNSEHAQKMAEAGEPIEDNRWLKYYRDELNVNIEYTLTSSTSSDYNQLLLLAMTAGDLPDIFWIDSLSLLAQLAEGDALYDMTEVYQNNVNTTFANLLESEGSDIYSMGLVGDKLFAIPQKMPSTNAYNHCWVRRDWLNELGLSVPTTMDDVKAVTQAFVANKADNIGLMFSNSYMWEYQGIFWAFGGGNNMARNQWILMDDGSLAFAEVQPEMKDGLKWIADMYASGLISQEFSTMNTWEALSAYVPTNRTGIFYGPHWYGFQLEGFEESIDEGADWVPIGLPLGRPDVEMAVRANNVVDGLVATNANSANPEAAVHLLNAYVEKLFGDNADFANFFSHTEDSAFWKASPVWSLSPTVDLDPCEIMMNAWDNNTKTMDVSKLYGAGATYWDYITNGDSAYQYMFGPIDSCFVFVKQTYPDIMLWNKYLGAPTPTQNDRWSSMQELIDTTFLKMITGELDIDRGFDEMVNQWYSMGGTDVTAEINEAYKIFN